MQNMIYSVTDVNNEIKNIFDKNPNFKNIFVSGEISNYKHHTSGHHYLTLKDNDSVLSAVMFKFQAVNISFKPQNGMKVIARGRISSFPKNGQYQMYISDMIVDGAGDLHIAFEKLKHKLYDEGLFNQDLKKDLPRFPKNIGIVTSPTGAAIRDIIRILKVRYPLSNLRIYPVLVQGEGAAETICNAINFINNEDICDLIITGRGGGSIEDLWAFNDEMLARTIFASNIPVVSAVGHEPDITISDFVADARASTPSNAAEIAVPDKSEIKRFLNSVDENLLYLINVSIIQRKNDLSRFNQTLENISPKKNIDEKRLIINHLFESILVRTKSNLAKKRGTFTKYVAYLDALSPLKVLSRGYSVTTDDKDNILINSKNTDIGNEIFVRLAKGQLKCTVTDIYKEVSYNGEGKKRI